MILLRSCQELGTSVGPILCWVCKFVFFYIWIVEDDFVACPHAASHFMRIFYKMRTGMKNFAAIRLSFGLNGIILQCKDIPNFIRYIEEYKKMGPRDSLLGKYLTNEEMMGRLYYTYQHNLLRHIGVQSSKGNLYSTKTPECGDILRTGSIMSGENYNPKCKEFSYDGCEQQQANTAESLLEAWNPSQLKQEMPVEVDSVFAGEIGQNCEQVCSAQKKQCISQMLPFVNTCEHMKKHFDCKYRCNEYDFYMDYTLRAPAFEPESFTCYTGNIRYLFNCKDSDERLQRLCVCA